MPDSSIYPPPKPRGIFVDNQPAKNPGHKPIVIAPGVGAGGIPNARADNSSKLALYGGKNSASGQFARRQPPASAALNNTGNTTEIIPENLP